MPFQPVSDNAEVPSRVYHGLFKAAHKEADVLPAAPQVAYWIDDYLAWAMVRDLPATASLMDFYSVLGQKAIRRVYVRPCGVAAQSENRVVFQNQDLVRRALALDIFCQGVLHGKPRGVQHPAKMPELPTPLLGKTCIHPYL
jgi:hypothetical protein